MVELSRTHLCCGVFAAVGFLYSVRTWLKQFNMEFNPATTAEHADNGLDYSVHTFYRIFNLSVRIDPCKHIFYMIFNLSFRISPCLYYASRIYNLSIYYYIISILLY